MGVILFTVKKLQYGFMLLNELNFQKT